MAQKPNISAQDTLQFLQQRLDADVADLTLLQGGDWSQAYSFVHHRQRYVVRWCCSSETFEKDAAVSPFSSAAMPIPKITDSGVAFETHFAISEFAQGTFFEALSSDELNATLPALLDLFDALRTVDLSHTRGYGGWDKNGVGNHTSWKSFLLDVKTDHTDSFAVGWYAALAELLGTQVFDQLYSRLEALVDKCPEVRELIHSDLLNSNLLVSASKISAVIDWQCSLYGDSLYDLAWFVFYAPWYPQFAEVQLTHQLVARFATSAADITNLQPRLLCYQLHIGLGSIAYNAFKKDWKTAQEIAEYTLNIAQQTDSGE